MRKIFLIVSLILLGVSVFSQVDCKIPENHLAGDKEQVLIDWAGAGMDVFTNEEGEPKKLEIEVIDVSDHGIFPNDVPCGRKIKELFLDKTNGKHLMLYFPSGTYIVEEPISLPDSIILKGAMGANNSPDKSELRFSVGESHCITMGGVRSGVEDLYLTNCYWPELIPTQIPSLFINNKLTYSYSFFIDKLYTIVRDNQGDVVSEGWGEVFLFSKGIYTCPVPLNNEVYDITTILSLGYNHKTINHSVKVKNGKLIVSSPPINNNVIKSPSDTLIVNTDSAKNAVGGITINISGSHNWVRGVDSHMTQKYHVYINGGEHNTVSGCYFHHSYNYGDGGTGYGVCLSGDGNTKFNLVEDNVFRMLRHSIVFQFGVERNVVAYNSSIDAWAFDGEIYHGKSSDLCLHGGKSIDTTPSLNLMEGNIVERAHVHDAKEKTAKNGPHNTFFRNRAIYNFKLSYVKPEYQEYQYAQNVIGCNMDRYTWKTIKRLDKNDKGHRDCYNGGDMWSGLINARKSLYQDSVPDFFSSGFAWPFVPAVSNVIPARDRWNMYVNEETLSPIVFQGWYDYKDYCAPPNLKYVNETWLNETEDKEAMEKIILDHVLVYGGSSLTLRAGDSIIFRNGTHIHYGSVVNTENFSCDGKGIGSKYDFYSFQQMDLEKGVLSVVPSPDLQNDIVLYPNPNQGTIFIKSKREIEMKDIHLFGIFGQNLSFQLHNNKLQINDNYKGVVIVKISLNNKIHNFKLIIN